MNKFKKITTFILLFTAVFFSGCSIEPFEGTIPDQNNPEPVDPAFLPVLITANYSNILATTATSGGTITSDGGTPVAARGVVWSTSQNPTTANSKTVDGTGTGTFASSITGLTAGTTYYVRAYATNSNGTSYGNQITFVTPAAPGLPVLTTTAITNNTAPNATSGGNITSDGGSPITDRGVVWGYSPNFIAASNRTTYDGTGTGSFVSHITPTMPGQVYYVRAYARNVNGISYGNELVFTGSAGSVDNSSAMMTANINGVQFDFMRPYLYSLTNNDVIVENDGAPAGETRYLKIQGDTSDNLTTLTEINLHIPNDKWVLGTYPLTGTFDLGGPSICQANLVLPFVAGNPDVSTVTGGSITITEFNLTTKRIKGTFTITYQKGGLPTDYQITNGTFNYGLDDDYFD